MATTQQQVMDVSMSVDVGQYTIDTRIHVN